MANIDTLIRDLEAATKGSRELDAEVMRVAGFIFQDFGGKHWAKGAYPYGEARPPNFSPTTSLDAALTLVPEGWSIAGIWESVHRKDRPWWGINLRRDDPYKVLTAQGSPIPSLAVCIAALKARGAP